MTTGREVLYRKFGPLLLEAIVRTVLQEINILRTAQGLPLRTLEQVSDTLNTVVDSLPLHDWQIPGHG